MTARNNSKILTYFFQVFFPVWQRPESILNADNRWDVIYYISRKISLFPSKSRLLFRFWFRIPDWYFSMRFQSQGCDVFLNIEKNQSWANSGRNRAVFKWLSKVITSLRLLRLVIGLKDSRQFFNQWEAKPKPIAPCTRDFSRALNKFQIIARNCDWLIALFAPVVIGRSNCFGFGFPTVIWKPLYVLFCPIFRKAAFLRQDVTGNWFVAI